MAEIEKLERWKQKLSNLTELTLPSDYPRPVPSRIVEAQVEAQGSSEMDKDIIHLATRENTTIFNILLSTFIVLLHKYTGEEDVVIGSTVMDNPSVLRCRLSDDDSWLKVVKMVQDVEEDARKDAVSFGKLLHHLFPNASPDQPLPALFKVRFLEATESQESLESPHPNLPHLYSDLTVFVKAHAQIRHVSPVKVEVSCLYNSLLFSSSRILDMFDAMALVLRQARENPGLEIGEMSIVTNRARLVIPDPKSPLDWHGWQGAITDIFHSNALKHPDRLAVSESLNDENLRNFSYKQIDEASNCLAHYLISKGVERGDVVTTYAYRGVELVVAVMGILKAGAVFNVIDPQYPPQRQTIYLGVAQPRALIVCKRAVEGGLKGLDSSVSDFIDQNLALKVAVSGLFVKDDGSLQGGSTDDSWFQEMKHKSDFPGVKLGPDSIGTLSFTSGSTGIPKGVRGRHFSLTHFYPWMRQRFGLTQDEHFTMLSGIAHDPIQRDIFTPLFLGASLHVPTADHIATPGALASWMADRQITVTHLTPAMGQLLSAGATTLIPSLRNSFFVGDVLTKRDVVRLQSLAENVAVINMYGTTETQRAVSYLRIPSRSEKPNWMNDKKDIMPAGLGMKDVQLLVINNKGLLCGIGELGELYVRSGGLAEGYLRLPDATAEKFVPNPFNPQASVEKGPHPSNPIEFYHGARDRMYKTGDLGRYLPGPLNVGDRHDEMEVLWGVECSGRKDDQVKIRGFRIELGEIDTHLSQYPQIRENVTLVRRDKYEEQTLVSYLVTHEVVKDKVGWEKELREYLKGKLPGYAIPTVFVHLRKMPLTPNGKVDKNALPYPDTARFRQGPSVVEVKVEDGKDLTPTQKVVQEAWQRLLGVDQVGLQDNFFDLGGHSVLATRLVFELRSRLGVDLSLGVVFKDPTVAGMSKEIDGMKDAEMGVGLLVDGKEVGEAILDYAKDVNVVDKGWKAKVDWSLEYLKKPKVVFLTGATGFLGAFILKRLLDKVEKVYVLVRGKNVEDAKKRVKDNAIAHLIWKDDYEDKVVALVGDLGLEKFGLDDDTWSRLCKEVDAIVHNGAMVHWVYPYGKLRAPNVLSTVTCLDLATTDKIKPLHFVSSTSVLDTPHYISMLGEDEKVSEKDDLEGSRTGLKSGYGQTKWVSEKLLMKCHERGLPITIIRPGYIVGDSKTGVTNTDDFLIRLIKGCLELGKVPEITNVVNMCPVDYVAGVVGECVLQAEEATKLMVFHTYNPHKFRFVDMFRQLKKYGYKVSPSEYVQWRSALMDMVTSQKDSPLYPLLHFVMDDLPTSTKSPELDDFHAVEICKDKVECASMESVFGLYLAYLKAVGFLDAPTESVGKTLGVRGLKRSGSISGSISLDWLQVGEVVPLPTLVGVDGMTMISRRNRE